MTEPLGSAPNRTGEIVFELDRFELVDRRRLELSGRWFGVRGRRFLRPQLTFVAGGKPHRCLADVENKPWAAEDGARWRAAFPFEVDAVEVVEAQLRVAPDITIALPPPAGVGGGAPAGTRRRAVSAPRDDATRDLNERSTRERGDLRRTPEAGLRRELAALTRELGRERRKTEEQERDLDEAIKAREQALAEREVARRLHQEALGELAEARAARDRAIAERDAAAARIEALGTERAEAISARAVTRDSVRARGRRTDRTRRLLWQRLATVAVFAIVIAVVIELVLRS
jgi:hypothetical protein